MKPRTENQQMILLGLLTTATLWPFQSLSYVASGAVVTTWTAAFKTLLEALRAPASNKRRSWSLTGPTRILLFRKNWTCENRDWNRKLVDRFFPSYKAGWSSKQGPKVGRAVSLHSWRALQKFIPGPTHPHAQSQIRLASLFVGVPTRFFEGPAGEESASQIQWTPLSSSLSILSHASCILVRQPHSPTWEVPQ